MENYFGKIKSITQPAESVVVCLLECNRRQYNKETGQNEPVKKIFPVKCFGWVKDKIANEYNEGDFIQLFVETDSREYQGNYYIDLICKGLILYKEHIPEGF